MKTESKKQYQGVSSEIIKKFDGILWEKNGQQRVYFNALEKLF
jgi:hypothetical protein